MRFWQSLLGKPFEDWCQGPIRTDDRLGSYLKNVLQERDQFRRMPSIDRLGHDLDTALGCQLGQLLIRRLGILQDPRAKVCNNVEAVNFRRRLMTPLFAAAVSLT
jgi:hypothetical protein